MDEEATRRRFRASGIGLIWLTLLWAVAYFGWVAVCFVVGFGHVFNLSGSPGPTELRLWMIWTVAGLLGAPVVAALACLRYLVKHPILLLSVPFAMAVPVVLPNLGVSLLLTIALVLCAPWLATVAGARRWVAVLMWLFVVAGGVVQVTRPYPTLLVGLCCTTG